MNTYASENVADKVGQTKEQLCGVNKDELMFNATAIRARAGILNVIIGTTIFVQVTRPELEPVFYVALFLLADMIGAVIFGLSPASPTGFLGNLLTTKIRPVWTPHRPKRFAWSLGATLAVTCLALVLLDFNSNWIVGTLGIFFVLTWLDAALGFCVGCWIYSKLFDCQVCEIG